MLTDYAEFSAAFPWFSPSVAFVFGAIFGSFFNVCIYRIPVGKSVARPGSHCACGAPIPWYNNLPILSWFILRGRAKCCGRPYSFRYPFVELLTAALFLACWCRFAPEAPAKAFVAMFFVSVLICATFIDLDHMIIPDVFTIGAGAVGVLLAFLVPSLHGHHHDIFFIASFRSGIDALQGLLIGSGLVLWIALLAEAILKKEAMGFGDVKFVGAIGAFCGWQGAVFSVFGGAIVGTVWFACALLWQKINPKKSPSPVAEKSTEPKPSESPQGSPPLALGVEVPFGPMLAIAGLLYFLIFSPWVSAYFAEIKSLLLS